MFCLCLFLILFVSGYYYGLSLAVTNLSVALVPIAMVSFPVMQLTLMCAVLWWKQTSLCLLWPWRYAAASYHDLFLSAGTLLLLNLVSPLLILEDDNSSSLLSLLLAILVLGLPVVTAVAVAGLLWRFWRKDTGFAMFLSHHKAAAGALCRLLTIVLQEHKKQFRWQIFLDSDRLEEVTSLVDIIRYQTKCFVPVISQEYFQRPWCVAELATAFLHNVPLVPLLIDGFTFSEDGLQTCEQVCSSFQGDFFEHLQVSSETLRAAYEHISGMKSETKVSWNILNRNDSVKTQELAMLNLAETVQSISRKRASSNVPPAPYMLISTASKARIFVCASEEPEAHSTVSTLMTSSHSNFWNFNDYRQVRNPPDMVEQAFRRLFVTIALPFSPAGTFGKTLER
ncbi:unnamed protein product [Effrenium voratum]|uniref:TIR domain-containing protein n=1 Tax=Effrenium voratum TaxID=2562239 RepID=A0AA36J0J8_9DINO|nr:unnamed protein product [Effrenium voratum]